MKIETLVEKNICVGCGKEYEQALCTTPFCVVITKYCDDCVNKAIQKEEAKQKALEKMEREKKYKEMGIEKDYYNVTFRDYQAETDSQKRALEVCKMIVQGDLNKAVFLGGNGVGKTHLSAALVKRLNGRLMTAYEMFALYRSCMSGRNDELKLIRQLSDYSVLVIDEFGRTKGSEAEENFLSVVVDKRHAGHKPTVINSNLIRMKDCVFVNQGRCDTCSRRDCLESRLSPDVISRLCENTEIVTIQGEDYRRAKKR